MKNFNILLFFICALAVGCSSSKSTATNTERDGTSIPKAVIAKSIGSEYEWVRANYPGSQVVMQALLEKKGKHYDMLRVKTAEGKIIEVYFDINSFYGRGW